MYLLFFETFLSYYIELFISGIATAAPDFNPASLNPAGTINTHDMETLKRFEMEQQEQQDFEKYKQNNEKKEKVKKEKK